MCQSQAKKLVRNVQLSTNRSYQKRLVVQNNFNNDIHKNINEDPMNRTQEVKNLR